MRNEEVPLLSAQSKCSSKGLSLLFATLCVIDLFGVFPIVALPRAIVDCGWLGLPLAFTVFTLQIYTALLLGRSWVMAEMIEPSIVQKSRYPYAALAELTFDTRMSKFVTFLLDITIFGGGVPNLLVADEESVNFATSPPYANSDDDDDDEDNAQDPMYEGNDVNAFLTGENHMYSQLLGSFKTHTQEMLAAQNKATLSFIKELNKSNEAMLERMAAAAEADRQHLKSMMKDLGQTMAQTFMQAIPAMMGAFTQGMRQGGFMAQSASCQPTNFGESCSMQSGANFGNAFTFPNVAAPPQPSPAPRQQPTDERKDNLGIDES